MKTFKSLIISSSLVLVSSVTVAEEYSLLQAIPKQASIAKPLIVAVGPDSRQLIAMVNCASSAIALKTSHSKPSVEILPTNSELAINMHNSLSNSHGRASERRSGTNG